MRRRFILLLPLLIGACSIFEGAQQRYAVFFQEWSAQLDDSAKAVVNGAAAFAQRHPEQPVVVSGFADPEGSPQANKDMSRLRAQIVSDQLVAAGVAPDRIRRRAVGSVDFSGSSQESRRVEILVGMP